MVLCAGAVGLKDKMRVWEQFNRLKRAEEQKAKVLGDAQAMVKYYTQLGSKLRAAAPIHDAWLGENAADGGVQAGMRALMLAGRKHVDAQLCLSQQLVNRISS
jgi:hypothetical protein